MENKEYSKEDGCKWCDDCHMMCNKMHGMGGHGMGRHFVLRWILGILILAFVFGAGIKLGELEERIAGVGYGMMNGGYNYNMMQRGGYAPEAYYYRGGMMQGWFDNQRPATTTR